LPLMRYFCGIDATKARKPSNYGRWNPDSNALPASNKLRNASY
jgi:hypothetical protein